jgi:hypothetical protein
MGFGAFWGSWHRRSAIFPYTNTDAAPTELKLHLSRHCYNYVAPNGAFSGQSEQLILTFNLTHHYHQPAVAVDA